MTATPFVYQTAAQRGATDDLQTVIKDALDNSLLQTIPRTQLMVGLTTRPDTTLKTLRRIHHATPTGAFGLTAALLNNPRVQQSPKLLTEVRESITPDAIDTLLTNLNNPADFLPDIVLASYGADPTTLTNIRNIFTPTQIQETVTDLVQDYATFLVHGPTDTYIHQEALTNNTFLDPNHITTLLNTMQETINAVAEDRIHPDHQGTVSHYDWVLWRFLLRDDLNIDHENLIVDICETIATLEKQHHPPFDVQQKSRLARTMTPDNLTDDTLIRILSSPTLAQLHVFASPVNPRVVTEALRRGANPAILRFYRITPMTPDVLDILLNTLESTLTNPDHNSAYGKQSPFERDLDTLRIIINEIFHLIGTPQFQTFYDLWVAVMPPKNNLTPTGQFVNLIERHTPTQTDPAKTPITHTFAVWASTSNDQELRAHAVKHIDHYPQLAAAAHDPNPLVRAEAAAHRLVDLELLTTLATDTNEQVRNAAAEKFLTLFNK